MELFFGALLLFGLISLANHLTASGREQTLFDVLLLITHVPLLLLSYSLRVVPPELTAVLPFAPTVLVLPLLVAGAWGCLAALRPLRRLLALFLPLDPRSPIQALALAFAGYLVAYATLVLQDGLDTLLASAEAATLVSVILQGILFTILAFSGVGLFIRRDWPAALARLGLERPSSRQLLSGLRWILVLIVLQGIGGGLWAMLDPERASLIESVNTTLLGNIDSVQKWLVLALATGFSEEVLFRGALQPVFGIWLTSALFAVPHVQYGFTPVTAVIFIIGVILGYIRQRENTTTAIFIHFGYNFVLGLLSLVATTVNVGG